MLGTARSSRRELLCHRPLGDFGQNYLAIPFLRRLVCVLRAGQLQRTGTGAQEPRPAGVRTTEFARGPREQGAELPLRERGGGAPPFSGVTGTSALSR